VVERMASTKPFSAANVRAVEPKLVVCIIMAAGSADGWSSIRRMASTLRCSKMGSWHAQHDAAAAAGSVHDQERGGW
jgi:hypothetical protein